MLTVNEIFLNIRFLNVMLYGFSGVAFEVDLKKKHEIYRCNIYMSN